MYIQFEEYDASMKMIMTNGRGWIDVGYLAEVNGRWMKLWWMVTNGDINKIVTDEERIVMEGDCNEWQQQRTTTVTTLQSDPHPWALQQWRAKEKGDFFSFTLWFFYKKILFFAFSTDLVACSFDHLCKEPTKMEIKKSSLKKWRKPSVYRSGVPLTNLHEELEHQRS